MRRPTEYSNDSVEAIMPNDEHEHERKSVTTLLIVATQFLIMMG